MAPLSYRRHRFPAEIIKQAIWLYLRFTLSYRDVEELLAERGLDVSYEVLSTDKGARSRFGAARVRPTITVRTS
jgi:transposase-like protein